jgi:hypothetical protein
MRTAGALKLNEQLQPVGTQIESLRSKQFQEATHPRIHVKHPRILEFIGVFSTQNIRKALNVSHICTVIKCEPRTIHNPDPFCLDLIQIDLHTIEILFCAHTWKECGSRIVQRDSVERADEFEDRFHYSGRRGMPEILSATDRGARMELMYQRELWRAWRAVPEPVVERIPVRQHDLQTRMSGGDSFDGGRTATWLAAVAPRRFYGVRDLHTGHEVHCVTDRSWSAVSRELVAGLRIMAWMTQARPYVWFWWDQDWQRVLPARVDPGREHVNGGWAIPRVPEVHVYRREEALKVMIHESIHALGLDVNVALVDPIRGAFEAALGRRLWPHLGEAYTELFAEWLWAVAGARSEAGAARRWLAQRACAERQAAAVWVRIRDSREDEDTNVFAYYILKWVLMRHLREALLQPSHAVQSWFLWFQGARSTLDALADAAAPTERQALRLGMTCQPYP